jgi:hypothetical protein
LREAEVCELEHGFEIPAGTVSGESFLQFSDERVRSGEPARERFLQVNCTKFTEAASGDDLSAVLAGI